MKNAGLAGAIALCGIGLIMIGLGTPGVTPTAMGISSDDSLSGGGAVRDAMARESTQRRSLTGCYPGPPVTWPVFDPLPRLLELVRGAESLDCWSSDDSTVDFDGDGSLEQYNTSGANAGVEFSGGGVQYSVPFSVLRRAEDGVALEVVMEFDGGIQYWLDALEIEPRNLNRLALNIRGFFDVDGDGLPDALLRASVSTLDGAGNYSGQDLWFWFRNQLTPPRDRIAADVNNDGQVNGADLTIVLSEWTG